MQKQSKQEKIEVIKSVIAGTYKPRRKTLSICFVDKDGMIEQKGSKVSIEDWMDENGDSLQHLIFKPADNCQPLRTDLIQLPGECPKQKSEGSNEPVITYERQRQEPAIKTDQFEAIEHVEVKQKTAGLLSEYGTKWTLSNT